MENYDIFISYKVDTNQTDAKKLYDVLENKGYSVFLDKEKLQGGKEWNPQLEYTLNTAKCCFIFTTPESLNAFQDGWDKEDSDTYSYYCHEINLIVKRLNDNSSTNKPLCIPLFTEPIETFCKGNEYIRNNPNAEQCIQTLAQVQGYQYSKIQDNLTFAPEFIDKICKQLSNEGIYPFGKKGKHIFAKEFFYDEGRATKAQGFREERQYYVERDIDNTIRNFTQNTCQECVLIITGRAGAGKTRAVYEWIRSNEMAEEQIVVLRKDNINKIYNTYKLSINNGQCIYFVCDQVHDVLNRLTVNQQKDFFNKIYNSQHNKFIGTDTPHEFEDLYKSNIFDIDYFYKKKKSYFIDELTDDERIEFQKRYELSPEDAEKCHIAADFIKPLREHKYKIINAIESGRKRTETQGIEFFLKAIQLCKLIKGNIILDSVLPILKTTSHTLCNDSFIINCLNFLSRHEEGINLIDFSYDGRELDELTTFDYPIENASEIAINIHDDLAWEMMQDHINGESILFDLYSGIDTERIFNVIDRAFETPQELCKLLYDLPWNNKHEKYEDYVVRCNIIRKCAIKSIDRRKGNGKWNLEIKDYRNVISAITERSLSVEQISYIFDNYLPQTDAKAIRSLYRIAKRWHLKIGNERNFIGFDELLQQKTTEYYKRNIYSVDDISRIFYEIESDYKKISFDDVYQQIESCFKEVISIDEKIRNDLDFLLTTLVHLCKQRSHFDQLWFLMDSILSDQYYMSIYTAKAISRAISDFFFYEDTKEEELQLLSSLIDRIPGLEKGINNTNKRNNIFLYTARIIIEQRCFTTSTFIYENVRERLGIDNKREHETRIVSMCLNKCQRNEFSKALSYVKELQLQDKGIAFNILISKAPTLDDAYYILKLMSKDNIDCYTLSNCLRKVESFKLPQLKKTKEELQKIGDPRYLDEEIEWLESHAKENDKIVIDYAYNILKKMPIQKHAPWHSDLLEYLRNKEKLNFMNVYEILNHPKFAHVKQNIDPPCINILYKCVQNEDQETYIHRLINPTAQNLALNKLPQKVLTEQIMPTLISKPYRSIRDAFIIYKLFGDRKYLLTQNNIFNALYSKYIRLDTDLLTDDEKKELNDNMQELEKDVQITLKRGQITEDIYLFCNRRRWQIKSNETINKEDGHFIFKPNSKDFTEVFYEVLKHEKLRKLSQEDIRKRFLLTFKGIFDCYDENKIERCIVVYKHFADYFDLKWHPSIKFFLKTNFPDNDKIDNFIEQFQTKPNKENKKRQRSDYEKKTLEQVFEDFRRVIELHHMEYVSPSDINFYLGLFCDILKNNKGEKKSTKIYQNTASLLNKYNLIDNLNSRSYEMMVRLAPKEEKNKWLQLFDQPDEDLSEKALGALSVNSSIEITRSREYFNRWLNCFKDVYVTPKRMANYLSIERTNTLGRRLRIEMSLQNKDVQSRATINNILIIYSYSHTAFSEDNFGNIGIKDAIQYVEKKEFSRVYKKITTLESQRILGKKAIDTVYPYTVSRQSFKKWIQLLKNKYGTLEIIARMISKTDWTILFERLNLEKKIIRHLIIDYNKSIISLDSDDLPIELKDVPKLRKNQEQKCNDILESIATMEEIINIYIATQNNKSKNNTPLFVAKTQLQRNQYIGYKGIQSYLNRILKDLMEKT